MIKTSSKIVCDCDQDNDLELNEKNDLFTCTEISHGKAHGKFSLYLCYKIQIDLD